MVGINVGAHQAERARRMAWTGAAVATGGGWVTLHWGGLEALFGAMALSLVLFGGLVAGALRLGAWDTRRGA